MVNNMDLKRLPNGLIDYLINAKNFSRQYPNSFDFWHCVRVFPDWLDSLDPKRSPLTDERPWITFAAIEFLEKNLRKDMRVYEYGVGGSTLFFLKRVKEVISVEHDPIWFNQVADIVEKRGCKNWNGCLIEPSSDPLYAEKEPSEPDDYISGSHIFQGKMFQDYAASIDKYPDNYFNVILIDGRARPSCFKHSLKKITKNGWIIWDNTDRSYYHKIIEKNCVNMQILDFPSPSPYVNFFTRTSAFYNT